MKLTLGSSSTDAAGQEDRERIIRPLVLVSGSNSRDYFSGVVGMRKMCRCDWFEEERMKVPGQPW